MSLSFLVRSVSRILVGETKSRVSWKSEILVSMLRDSLDGVIVTEIESVLYEMK